MGRWKGSPQGPYWDPNDSGPNQVDPPPPPGMSPQGGPMTQQGGGPDVNAGGISGQPPSGFTISDADADRMGIPRGTNIPYGSEGPGGFTGHNQQGGDNPLAHDINWMQYASPEYGGIDGKPGGLSGLMQPYGGSMPQYGGGSMGALGQSTGLPSGAGKWSNLFGAGSSMGSLGALAKSAIGGQNQGSGLTGSILKKYPGLI